QLGSGFLERTDLAQTIITADAADAAAGTGQGLWAVEAEYPFGQFPIMFGAPSLNSTNFYPETDRWRVVDPDGTYGDVYNRYAHIKLVLTEDKTSFTLIQADYFELNLYVGDLKTLGVRYLITRNTYEGSDDGIAFTFLAQANGFQVYRLEY
ncbi:MAG: hypothetical protein FWF49_04080, partial [Oscillospiraceae bacterium]|nr:hypothetical protein [Oscillospiraceae bacterium]